MGQVSVTLNGRTFQLWCGDGQEAYVSKLSGHIANHIEELKSSFGSIDDDQLFLMAGLMVADEMLASDADEAQQSHQNINQQATGTHGAAVGVETADNNVVQSPSDAEIYHAYMSKMQANRSAPISAQRLEPAQTARAKHVQSGPPPAQKPVAPHRHTPPRQPAPSRQPAHAGPHGQMPPIERALEKPQSPMPPQQVQQPQPSTPLQPSTPAQPRPAAQQPAAIDDSRLRYALQQMSTELARGITPDEPTHRIEPEFRPPTAKNPNQNS